MKEYEIVVKAKYPYTPKFDMESAIKAAFEHTLYARGFLEVAITVKEIQDETSM